MMKKVQFYFLAIILLATACNQTKDDSLTNEIAAIRQNNIPDTRLLYWNINVETENNTQTLAGATASVQAYSELEKLAKDKHLDFDVELYPTNDFKENPWGVVTLSVCNIRGKASHSAELLTQALMGTPVKVYAKHNSWYLVQTPDYYFGWVDNAAIALKPKQELAKWKALNKVLYKKQSGFAYTDSGELQEVESDLILGNLLSVTGEQNNFYKVVFADGRKARVNKNECTSLEIWKAKNVNPEDLLTTASQFKGIPYLWGGTSAKMADCSGFTKSTYYYHGIILQRDASQQTLYGALVNTDNGYDALQPGDLVFFGRKSTDEQKERVTHVGLCLGNQEFIHASGKVRINSLLKDSEKYTEYYETAFVRARRVIGNIDGNGLEWVVDNDFYSQILPD